MVRSWQRVVVGALLVALVATAGIAANFALLGLTQDAKDPAGKLSPRTVFVQSGESTTTPSVTTDGDDTRKPGHDSDD